VLFSYTVLTAVIFAPKQMRRQSYLVLSRQLWRKCFWPAILVLYWKTV